MNIQLSVPEGFYQEEERLGYTVTPHMKKVWAVQMDLLDQLKQICKKHGLTYYADSGTLLGAIRHKGYIPWDDDIDIVMKRADYQKLIELGKTGFKHPYFLQSAHSEVFPRGYARLRNSDSLAMTRFDLGQKMNHGIFIDIFPLDNVPDDLSEREKWLKEIRDVHRIMMFGVRTPISKIKTTKGKIKYLGAKLYFKIAGYEKVIDKYEKICSRYNKQDTKLISYVAHSMGKEKHLWDRHCFDSCHNVPFEFTDIAIPDGYDSRLKTEYKDYMQVVRADSTHGRMLLDPDTPYREYLQKHTEEEIKNLVG